MSSTSRGAVRAENDTYFTKYPVALAVCERLRSEGLIRQPARLLEPSAGKGSFLVAMRDTWPEAHITGVDINTSLVLPEHRASVWGKKLPELEQADFLEYPGVEGGFDAIIGNPPYADAEQHIVHAVKLLSERPWSYAAFLLRLNILGGVARQAGLYRVHKPRYVFVLDKRPSFQDDNSTDSCEYAVILWGRPSREPFDTILRMLPWRNPYFVDWAYTPQKNARIA